MLAVQAACRRFHHPQPRREQKHRLRLATVALFAIRPDTTTFLRSASSTTSSTGAEKKAQKKPRTNNNAFPATPANNNNNESPSLMMTTNRDAAAGTVESRAEFVKRAHCLDHWQRCNDDIIECEFERAKLLLMVDKRPAVQADSFALNEHSGRWDIRTAPRLAVFDVQELRQKLRPYGLEIGTLNSVLLDVWGPQEQQQSKGNDYIALFGTSIRLMQPPPESGIHKDSYREELAGILGVRFLELRHALLTMDEDAKQREWLAKFQSVMRWFWMFLHCPTCKHPLKMRASKSSAHCVQCERDFYPPICPVVITLVHDEANEHALLVRHKGTAGQVFTCIAGFCSPGEPLEKTVCREVAEEVGIQCWRVQQLPGSQSWPIPSCSLMIPFEATATMEDKLETSIVELEYARWFSRDQVLEALRRVEKDPFLLGLQRHLQTSGKDPEVRRTLRYIPPHGAIAHHLIKNWALRTNSKSSSNL